MNAKLSDRSTGMWVIAGFVVWGVTLAYSQEAIYAARSSSTSTTKWDLPCYWIDSAPNSPYSITTYMSTATNPATPTRVGSYVHTAKLLSVGEGYGVVHTNGTQAGAMYEVQVTQPNFQVAADIIMNVGSSNCDISGVFGATVEGGWTNTTAFQAEYSTNKWARVCYLTTRPGVTQPHVDFKYVSGGVASDRSYADCVRFHLVGSDTITPTPVRISGFEGAALTYSGGSGARFVLLKCSALCEWQRVATNTVTPGSFPISAVGTAQAEFYGILSE
jgi:hypothetical protein